MTAPKPRRRWTKGELARCMCSGVERSGPVQSAPRGPGPPYVQIDGDEPHLCATAVWVDLRAANARPVSRTPSVQLAELSPSARDWFRALPRGRRAGAVVAALEAAAHQAAQLAAERDADHDARWCEVCCAYRGALVDGCLCAPE